MSEGSIDLKNVTLAFGEGRGAVTALENFTWPFARASFSPFLDLRVAANRATVVDLPGFGLPRGEPD